LWKELGNLLMTLPKETWIIKEGKNIVN